MIHISISRHGFIVEGHSGYAECGSDIVCAAVSALVDSTIMALDSECLAYVEVGDGKVDVRLNIATSKTMNPVRDYKLLTLPMRLGLAEIAKQYPDRVMITDE